MNRRAMEPKMALVRVIAVRNGEPTSEFSELYEAHYPGLAAELGFVCGDRTEGDDAAQEAFIRLLECWTRIARFDDPVAWVRHVGYNVARDRARRRASESVKAARWHRLIGRSEAAPKVDEYRADDSDPLAAALRSLPTAQREVLVLHAVHDFTNQQIADCLEVPVGTVKSRISAPAPSFRDRSKESSHDRSRREPHPRPSRR